MVITGKNPIVLNVVLTLLCASALAVLTIYNAESSTGLMAVAIVLTLFLSQLMLARQHARQLQRTDRYHRLGRKLLQLKRTKKRDEKIAIKVLNHIVNQSEQTSVATTIWQQPLETFSGDLALATATDGGKSYTLLADLTGHGIAAAMGATPVASIFQATARRGLSVEEIVVELNSKLTQMLPSGFFCCVAVVMCDKGQLTVCNAGLPTILVTDKNGGIADRIDSDQLPLGIQALDVENVSLFTRQYETGHQLYAYTDGLIEATNRNGKPFNEQMLEALISVNVTPQGRLEGIQTSFEQFVKGTQQSDDISMVEVIIC
jgi:serine phosphatase RsbU (regulator of sigma subunit)